MRLLKKQLKENSTLWQFMWWKFFPIVDDKYVSSAQLMHFYFYQDLRVAQEIYRRQPIKHVDIWSRIDWFVAHVATFRQIELFDIRPLAETIDNVVFTQWDLLDLEEKYHEYTDSLSSLSVLEHFWLGRYGDSIDAYWYLKWINAVHNMLKKWWIFYCSLPIWPQRIEFNAHRAFSVQYLLWIFDPLFTVVSYSYVDDTWKFFSNVPLTQENIANNYWCQFGNGIFVLQKK